MNISKTLQAIQQRTPTPPARREAHGAWIEPAWVVRALVEKEWGVSDAVRNVVEELDFPKDRHDAAFKGIRAAYYAIRNQDWPI